MHILQVGRLVAIVALLGLVVSVQAVPVSWENGGPDRQSGVTVNNSKLGADDFILPGILNQILGGSFYTLEEAGAWDGGLHLDFYRDNGGTPGDGFPVTEVPTLSVAAGEINVTRSSLATGISLGNFSNLTEYRYDFSIDPAISVELSGGHFWIAIYPQSDFAGGNPSIFWETSGERHLFAAAQSSDVNAQAGFLWSNVYYPPGSPGGAPREADLAFRLTYDTLIPVPAPLFLMAAGLVLLRRIRQHAASA